MKKKLDAGTFDAYEVTVKMEGDLQTYALNFLKIFNNVKTSKELIRVSNDYYDKVSVVCVEDSVDATKEFLSWFGEITDVEKVLCLAIEEDPEYDYNKYEDLIIVPYID